MSEVVLPSCVVSFIFIPENCFLFGMELSLTTTRPSGHISCPTHFSDILCNSFVIFDYVVISWVIWILWLMGFNVSNLTFIDSSYQVKESSLLQIFNFCFFYYGAIMMCANNWVHYSMRVVFFHLHITLPHYHYHACKVHSVKCLRLS